jgi:hypothetical protein
LYLDHFVQTRILLVFTIHEIPPIRKTHLRKIKNFCNIKDGI